VLALVDENAHQLRGHYEQLACVYSLHSFLAPGALIGIVEPTWRLNGKQEIHGKNEPVFAVRMESALHINGISEWADGLSNRTMAEFCGPGDLVRVAPIAVIGEIPQDGVRARVPRDLVVFILLFGFLR